MLSYPQTLSQLRKKHPADLERLQKNNQRNKTPVALDAATTVWGYTYELVAELPTLTNLKPLQFKLGRVFLFANDGTRGVSVELKGSSRTPVRIQFKQGNGQTVVLNG